MSALTGLDASTPLSAIEVRGFYGGQLVGLGAFILLGVGSARFVGPVLLLVAASLGGTALGRIAGVLAAGSLPPIIVGALALEIAATLAALLLWQRERRLEAA